MAKRRASDHRREGEPLRRAEEEKGELPRAEMMQQEKEEFLRLLSRAGMTQQDKEEELCRLLWLAIGKPYKPVIISDLVHLVREFRIAGVVRKLPPPDGAESENHERVLAYKFLEDLSDRYRALQKAGPTHQDVLRRLSEIDARLDRLHEPVIRDVQTTLDGLAGRDFGSLEANQAVARDVQALMNRLGLRVACPREGCGEPSSLRCRRAGRAKHGSFQLEHPIGGRNTNHSASTTLPRLRLVPAAHDRRRKGPEAVD